MRLNRTRTARLVGMTALCLALTGCSTARSRDSSMTNASGGRLGGRISIDGSNTVLPASKALTAAFVKENPGVQIALTSSGTGGGFKKFCAGQTDVNAASRPINAAESGECKTNHVDFFELAFAFDPLSVVVNPANTFVDCLTVGELKKMWEPRAQGTVVKWNQIRSAFPDRPLRLFGPGTASGTFDYFTLAIIGSESSSRSDFTKSDDDADLVRGVAGDQDALGYFGYSYYLANKDKLRAIAVDNGGGCILPSPDTVADSTYQPLSRPVFIYVSQAAASRPEVKALARLYLDPESVTYIDDLGYMPLPPATLLTVGRRLEKGITGSIFGAHGSVVGVTTDTFQDEDRIKDALVQ